MEAHPRTSATRLPPLAVPEIMTTAGLHELGHDAAAIRRKVRAGELVRLRRGHYAAPALGAAERERCRVLAVLEAQGGSPVVSHATAARAWGLPVRRAATTDVHLLVAGQSRSKRRGGVHLHGGRLAADEVTVHQGMPLTTLARTVIDMARSEDPGWALAAADAALHTGLVDRTQLDEQLVRQAGVRGSAHARAVVRMADARVESPGESLCRAALRQHGVPDPVLQQSLHDDAGFVGRVDFWWPQQRVVLEFDGREKYFANARPGLSPSDVLWAEKRREDRLRALGCTVVRCTWDEVLHHPEQVAERVLRALASVA
ncbi:type IV toxin-antitoxin system AbiEi family antitoxin domain-containing protein [Luteococcus peritonei]|uniref:Type IV toxin-antitoxin system AbiEi family antitoxin domain-containing protein n=1 Tax=Luteococcus peritonei TaxID=88874 RepID=A0ABW4RVN5_9ACTN